MRTRTYATREGEGDFASLKQVNYALSLMEQVGVGGSEVVDGQTSRKYGIPQGAPLKEVLESLTKREISELIYRLK